MYFECYQALEVSGCLQYDVEALLKDGRGRDDIRDMSERPELRRRLSFGELATESIVGFGGSEEEAVVEQYRAT